MKSLYHGTTDVFDEIDLNYGKGYKDFGKGFYATAIIRHAERITLRNKAILEKRQAIIKKRNPEYRTTPITAYRYNLLFTEEVSGLKVKLFESADTEWLRFIVSNRRNENTIHDYDIVIGPTADAETILILNQYEAELIESNYCEVICNKVIAELQSENLPKQYFFGTRKALETLSFDVIKRQVVMG